MRWIGLAVVLAFSLALAPLAAWAQQIGVRRLCVLAADSLSSPWASRYNAFKQGLSDLGYVDGRNITINFLSVDGQYGRFPTLAAECVRLRPDVIVADTTPGALAAKQATATIGLHLDPERSMHPRPAKTRTEDEVTFRYDRIIE